MFGGIRSIFMMGEVVHSHTAPADAILARTTSHRHRRTLEPSEPTRQYTPPRPLLAPPRGLLLLSRHRCTDGQAHSDATRNPNGNPESHVPPGGCSDRRTDGDSHARTQGHADTDVLVLVLVLVLVGFLVQFVTPVIRDSPFTELSITIIRD